MGLHGSSFFFSCFFAVFLSGSLAFDLSIISYDRIHAGDNNAAATMPIFESWLAKHGKVYNALSEKEKRFLIFRDNLRYIDEHNSDPARTFRLGLNRFADMTNEEFRSMYLGGRIELDQSKRRMRKMTSDHYMAGVGDQLPDSVDWRKAGAVTDVKDQGSGGCKCSWAFSAVAAIEGANKIAKNCDRPTPLSEQEFISCDFIWNQGCHGGRPDYVYEFTIANNGINTERAYPYSGTEECCNRDSVSLPIAKVVSIGSYNDMYGFDERTLQTAVSRQPVSVAIDASGRDFQLYHSGVYTGSCGTDLNHYATVVGYGSENRTRTDYWLVKNSWGKTWGERGYVRLERNSREGRKGGKCGIAMETSYPVIKKQV